MVGLLWTRLATSWFFVFKLAVRHFGLCVLACYCAPRGAELGAAWRRGDMAEH